MLSWSRMWPRYQAPETSRAELEKLLVKFERSLVKASGEIKLAHAPGLGVINSLSRGPFLQEICTEMWS